MKKPRPLLAPLAVAVAITLGACGADSGGTEPADTPSVGTEQAQPPAGPHNQADITFVAGMVPHHEQAVEMADLALELSENEEVLDLATRIKAAQDPEILTMEGWLEGWGPAATSAPAPPPAAPADPANPADPAGSAPAGGHDAHGMMTTEQLDTLANSTGEEFDQLWVDMMIEHHQGAVAMAGTVLESGQNPEVKQLAETIRKNQNAEIRELRMLQ